ncbi:MAG: site-2 protease family protein [Candidatus Methylomirabilales bacterium]
MPVQEQVAAPWPSVLARELRDVFEVRERWTHDGEVRFRGAFLVEPDEAVAILSGRLEPFGYVPLVQSPRELALVRYAYYAPAPARRAWAGWPLNLALLLATALTTLFVGALMEGADPLASPLNLLVGGPFAGSLLLILGFHELGHYLAARAYGVQVSLPYFIPLPLPPMGTMGAIIRMRSPIPNRKVLFDIGIAGPLLGLVFALPILALGLMLSPVKPLTGVALQEGNSLAYLFLKWLIKGPIAPGHDVMLHPLALAGWLGLFVTALNLMPLSQLDGGHLVYAVLGRRHRVAVWLFLGVLVVLYLVSRWEGWLVWIVLAIGLGLRHPPPLDDRTPLDPARRAFAVLALGLLAVLLTPLPFAVYEF